MSFWSTIQGLFTGDTYYPDNPRREARLKQLNSDCSVFLSESKKNAENLNKMMKKINASIAKCYPDGKVPEKLEIKKSICEKLPFDEMSEVFTPLLGIPAFSISLLFAQVVLEAKDGSELAAALEGTLGIAVMWCSGGMFFGCMPIAGLAIGAIQGSLKRDELKKLIPKAYEAREKIYSSYYINEFLYNSLQNINDSFNALSSLNIYTEDLLIMAFEKQIKIIKDKVKNIETEWRNELKKLDSNRSAWTAEDR